MEDKNLSYQESLQLINTMINKAKDAYHDTGTGAMLWGSVTAICALVRLSELQFGYKLPFDINLLSLVAIIPQIYITTKEKKERRVKSYDDRFFDYIWLGFGIAIFLLIHVVNLTFASWTPVSVEYKTLTGHSSPFVLSEFIMPLFLILYGLPTFITGAACRFRPMLWGGLFCWVCSVITVYTNIKIDLLLTALSAIVAWFIPGLIMEREYRQAKKSEAIAHV
ncbi:MAG: hypothetical protein H7X88_05265 [Gloeobacteraceae cyanobacterium ES-bin-316]|nr:hypothetical protein [Ferruginibacter sp.]